MDIYITVLCKCSVDGDQNMYEMIPTDIVVSCAHCPLESFCGDGTGFVVIKIN